MGETAAHTVARRQSTSGAHTQSIHPPFKELSNPKRQPSDCHYFSPLQFLKQSLSVKWIPTAKTKLNRNADAGIKK